MRDVMIFIGSVLLANAAWMLIQRLSARGTARGKVVDHEVRTGESSDTDSVPTTLYHAVIEFTPPSGTRHRFTAVGGDLERRPRRGSQVQVRYRRGNPETAFVATFSQMWVMPIAWAVAGAGILFIWW
ncbi:MAG: DUF3592 domain-containing protein [Vicinamibacterales bacterium]